MAFQFILPVLEKAKSLEIGSFPRSPAVRKASRKGRQALCEDHEKQAGDTVVTNGAGPNFQRFHHHIITPIMTPASEAQL
jgi:hypothetical protein